MSFIKTTKNIYKLTGMLLIAVIFVAVGIFFISKPVNFILNGLTTKAKVIHVERDAFWSNDSNEWVSTYHPTVRFYWHQKTYDAKVIMAGNQYENIHKGHTVEVRFLPDNPYVATPKWPWPQLIANGLFLIVGLFIFWLIYKEHTYKEPEYDELESIHDEIDTNSEIITKKHYAANISKGVFLFRLFLLLMIIGFGCFITYLIATDQTVDKIPIGFYPILIITFSIFTYGLTKSCFYQLIVTIDKQSREIRVSKKLFWSTKEKTLQFNEIQYIQASPKKFFYKDSGYYLINKVSEQLGDTATYYFFVYIKPFRQEPILFQKVKSMDKTNALAREYAEIIGCRPLTIGNKRVYSEE